MQKGSDLGSASFRLTVIIAICIFFTSCVPGLINRNSNPSSDAKKPVTDQLIKPRFTENTTSEKDKPSGSESSKTVERASSEKVAPQSARLVTRTSEEADRAEKKEKATRVISQKPAEPGAAEPKKESSDVSSKDPTLPEGPLKKFDHGKYLEQLRSRAVDLVNKEQNCSHALLCRDSITEEWSLCIYRIKDSHYIANVLVWDEIDEKWEEAFVSEKRPIGQMKEHLKISIVGKECKPLKGAIP
ncbi:MAG: hypothetical protein HY912_08015 [Desulfomonile tiedjei]|uniref:Lipoprotein n=1 Tax=Desulfomonile tiedjei TaxID=2358 RepID=A0A9D6UZR7_9BACT|nr:hypothetical protein [Desulfomonile tiedjei]